MRIIGLWNADHLSGVSTYARVEGSVIIPYGGERVTSNILFPSSAQQLSVTRTINGTARRTVNFKSPGTNSADLSIRLHFPSINDLAAFKNAGVKKHYIGVRVIASLINVGGKILHFGGANTTYYAPSLGEEVFIEIVTDLTTSYRVIYVNGATYTNSSSMPDVAGQVHVGNYISDINKLITTTSQGFDLADIYVAVAETDEEASVPRLGKMHIKTATLSTVSNDTKFTPMPKDYGPIPTILSMARNASGSTNVHVLTDSSQSKMALHFAAPTDGTDVLGASLRVATMKPAAAQAKTVVTMGETKAEPTVYDDTAAWVGYQPVSIPTPAGGWSEEAIGNLDIKIGSERTL